MSAKWIKKANTTSNLSNREKMRRKPLSLRNSRSTSLRFLYFSRSYGHGARRLRFGGPMGVAGQVRIVSSSYAVYRPRPSSRLLGEYADLLLRTTTYKNEYICRSTGIRSSRLRLYPEEFLRIKLLCPPLEEQHAIVGFVSKESKNARRSIDITHGEIDLLRGYRTRLSADVVTGKLDVREAATALPEGDPLAAENLLDDTLDTDAPTKPTPRDAEVLPLGQ